MHLWFKRARFNESYFGSPAFYRERVERNAGGPIVIHKDDREVELSRQGRIRYYLNHQIHKDTPLQQWLVFSHELRTTSGKHKHQGGLVIYVIEGRGYIGTCRCPTA